MSAKEALEWHLVSRVFPTERLEEETMNYARRVAKVPADLLMLHKAAVNRYLDIIDIRAAEQSSADIDVIAHQTDTVKNWMKASREKGLKGALAERDMPFGRKAKWRESEGMNSARRCDNQMRVNRRVGSLDLMKKYLLYGFISFVIAVGSFVAVLLAAGCSRRAATDTGMAVSFDGSTGEVSIPVVTTEAANVTLETWVKLPEGAKGCFVKIGDANTGYGIGAGASHTSFDTSHAGNALIGLYENSAFVYPAGDPTLSTGAWHHIAFVIGAAGSAPTFYIDGTPYAATAPGTPHAPTDGAAIGRDLGGDRWTNATLAKVAVYNSALSAARITAHATATSDAAYDAAVLADSPVAFYELNEENGGSAADSSGNSNTGTYSGGVTFLQFGPLASTQQPKE